MPSRKQQLMVVKGGAHDVQVCGLHDGHKQIRTKEKNLIFLQKLSQFPKRMKAKNVRLFLAPHH